MDSSRKPLIGSHDSLEYDENRNSSENTVPNNGDKTNNPKLPLSTDSNSNNGRLKWTTKRNNISSLVQSSLLPNSNNILFIQALPKEVIYSLDEFISMQENLRELLPLLISTLEAQRFDSSDTILLIRHYLAPYKQLSDFTNPFYVLPQSDPSCTDPKAARRYLTLRAIINSFDRQGNPATNLKKFVEYIECCAAPVPAFNNLLNGIIPDWLPNSQKDKLDKLIKKMAIRTSKSQGLKADLDSFVKINENLLKEKNKRLDGITSMVFQHLAKYQLLIEKILQEFKKSLNQKKPDEIEEKLLDSNATELSETIKSLEMVVKKLYEINTQVNMRCDFRRLLDDVLIRLRYLEAHTKNEIKRKSIQEAIQQVTAALFERLTKENKLRLENATPDQISHLNFEYSDRLQEICAKLQSNIKDNSILREILVLIKEKFPDFKTVNALAELEAKKKELDKITERLTGLEKEKEKNAQFYEARKKELDKVREQLTGLEKEKERDAQFYNDVFAANKMLTKTPSVSEDSDLSSRDTTSRRFGSWFTTHSISPPESTLNTMPSDHSALNTIQSDGVPSPMASFQAEESDVVSPPTSPPTSPRFFRIPTNPGASTQSTLPEIKSGRTHSSSIVPPLDDEDPTSARGWVTFKGLE